MAEEGPSGPFSPHEKEAEALLYSSLDDDAMSFVIGMCKDHFTSDYLLQKHLRIEFKCQT
jgi:hypothetical protein